MLPRFIPIFRNAGTSGSARDGLMYSQRNKAHQLLLSALQYLKGTCKEAGEGFLARACRDRTSGKGFKLKEGWFISNAKKTLYCEGGETL